MASTKILPSVNMNAYRHLSKTWDLKDRDLKIYANLSTNGETFNVSELPFNHYKKIIIWFRSIGDGNNYYIVNDTELTLEYYDINSPDIRYTLEPQQTLSRNLRNGNTVFELKTIENYYVKRMSNLNYEPSYTDTAIVTCNVANIVKTNEAVWDSSCNPDVTYYAECYISFPYANNIFTFNKDIEIDTNKILLLSQNVNYRITVEIYDRYKTDKHSTTQSGRLVWNSELQKFNDISVVLDYGSSTPFEDNKISITVVFSGGLGYSFAYNGHVYLSNDMSATYYLGYASGNSLNITDKFMIKY